MDWHNLSINQILDIVDKFDISKKQDIIPQLQLDERNGVKKIASRLIKEIDNSNKEIDRIQIMKKFEYIYMEKGAKYIAGIDEVGRGPLAGPVYAGAVIFPIDCFIEYVNDSKKLSPQRRDELYLKIKDKAISTATGYCDEKIVDKINILNATYEAMKQAIIKLKVKPDVILIDAVRIPGINIFQVPIIKGDELSFSIAAASIIAKVERDKVMDEYHDIYPVYNFRSNKGYGTKEHMDAIKDYGPCKIHRETFIKGIR